MLAPSCQKCNHLTGLNSCFPGPCRFHRDRNTPGTLAHDIAKLDRIRRGANLPLLASQTIAGAKALHALEDSWNDHTWEQVPKDTQDAFIRQSNAVIAALEDFDD